MITNYSRERGTKWKTGFGSASYDMCIIRSAQALGLPACFPQFLVSYKQRNGMDMMCFLYSRRGDASYQLRSNDFELDY